MPSPLGHALAGAAVALAADLVAPSLFSSRHLSSGNSGNSRRHPVPNSKGIDLKRGTAILIALAVLPDLDLVYPPMHRAVTHSVGSTIAVTIVAAVVTRWVTGRRSLGFGAVCGAAWASHLVLDWFGVDPNPPSGIQALWPFSHAWFISSSAFFPGTERRQLFTWAALLINLHAVAFETAVLAPIVAALWVVRRRLKERLVSR